MITASAASPKYFQPLEDKQNVYISGDHVARSPALFSYLQEKKSHAKENVWVVSIGSVNEEPNQEILQDYTLMNWFNYLLSKNSELVQNTMDTMLGQLVTKNNDKFFNFQLHRDADWEENFKHSLASDKTEILKQEAEQLISENREQIDDMLR